MWTADDADVGCGGFMAEVLWVETWTMPVVGGSACNDGAVKASG